MIGGPGLDIGRGGGGGGGGGGGPERATSPGAAPASDGAPVLSIDHDAPAAGSDVVLTAEYLATDGTVYDLVIAETAIASRLSPDPDGSMQVTVQIPEEAEGSIEIKLVETGSQDVVAAVVVEIPDASNGLATGAAWWAAGLLGLLCVAFVVGRRRRRKVPPTSPATTTTTTPASPVPVVRPPGSAPPAEPASTGRSETATAAPQAIVAEAATPPEKTKADAARSPRVVPVAAVPSRPWSSHDLTAVPLGPPDPGDLASWDHGLWMVGSVRMGGRPTLAVWSSLNGITWNEPIILGEGRNPRFCTDPTQIVVVATADDDTPKVWCSSDGVAWTMLAGGDDGQPHGSLTAATSYHGLLFLAAGDPDNARLWAGRRDGAWIRLDVGMSVKLLAEWDGRLLAIGTGAEGAPTVAESEAGIHWRKTPVDAPPSFRSFSPVALTSLEGCAVLLGTDHADRIADAWTSTDGVRWDPSPLGAAANSGIVSATTADGAVIAVGHEEGAGALWRTAHGVRWKRAEDDDGFQDVRVVAMSHYESRLHVVCARDDGRTTMWIREPWNSSPAAEGPERNHPNLRLVFSVEDAVDRPA